MESFAMPVNQQKLLKIAFFAGPFLLVLSALSFALGIGLIPPGITSYVEGIFGSFALLLFVPVYLYLAGKLSHSNKILGTIATITGLAGSVTGFAIELIRVLEYGLRQHGSGDEVWQSFYAQPNWEFMLVALMGPLFPITSIILGAGFLRAKTYPAWVAIGLMVSGIGFPLAQVAGFDWALKITYPGACLLWLVTLSYIGARLTDNRKSTSYQLSQAG